MYPAKLLAGGVESLGDKEETLGEPHEDLENLKVIRQALSGCYQRASQLEEGFGGASNQLQALLIVPLEHVDKEIEELQNIVRGQDQQSPR